MREIRPSGLMSGEGKRGEANGPRYRASPRLYFFVVSQAVADPNPALSNEAWIGR